MFRKLFTLFLLTLFVLPTVSNAQRLTEFSENKSEYIAQLETFMTSSKRKIMEESFKNFQSQFNGGAFTDEEIAQIIKLSTGMLKQKMTASPYFKNYLDGLSIVKKAEEGEKRFADWHLVLEGILGDIENRKLKPFKDYLSFSFDFFEKNAINYSKSGVSWYAVADKYDMKYEDKVPSISYEKLNLIGARKKDSILIQETSGSFFPVEGTWKGNEGKVDWSRFGLGDSIYCVLGEYTFEVKKSLYQVPKVKLYYPEIFPDGPIEGSFQDKITSRSSKRESSYPRFESELDVLKIDNIGGGAKYRGGFRLNGTTVYGYGSKDKKALISILNEKNEKSYRGAAELFVIRKGERIVGERVESTMYLGADSLYHPSVNLKFDIKKRGLNLKRGKRGSDRNPFFSTSHKMNIDAEKLDWLMDTDSIVFGKKSLSIAKANKKAVFESLKYFEEGDYRRLQNISSTNPLATLKVYADEQGTNILDANDLAKRLNPRFDVTSIQSLLYDLVKGGFIKYDSDKQIVEVKDKVVHFADASAGKVDYDVLKIISETDTTNAVMNVKDKTITTNSVKNVEFSLTQKVALKPSGSQLLLKENRDMDFDGKIYAGFGVFQGKDFSFNYNDFNIEMDSIRYMDLFVPTGEKDEKENPIALSIASRLEHTNGVLLIDAPENKSGKEDIEMFPSFNSKGPSYVYYDLKDLFSGAYKRDSFYFELIPFSFNSLDNFLKDDVLFKGKLVSAGIFPDFKETLVLQEEDQSLGFQTESPANGYPNYSDKGTYKGNISLSNAGLLGKGNLKYLGSEINSEDIIFKPKQMLASAERFDLKEDRASAITFPQAVGLDVSINWRPYRDSMYIKTKEAPFELYKAGLHTLQGTLILTPGGLKGDGLFDWDKASIESRMFAFGPYSAKADTSSLKIRAFGANDLAFNNNNVQSDVDFDEQKGRFKGNSDSTWTTMPYNQYQTSLNEFIWDMKEENITFISDEDKFGQFLSIHPNQDSLIFKGKTAFYDLKTNQLKIGGVPYIVTGDAFVYTETGDVEVTEGAEMATLTNAKIVADTVNKYHVINRATVDVKGRRLYKATGFYEYNIGDKEQEIEFANVIGQPVGKGKQSEKQVITKATGEVREEDNFYIDVKTEFRGKISLSADSKNLDFAGFAKLDAPKLPNKQWFSINSEGDKKDLAISYDVPKNYEGEPLRTGLFLSKETAEIYPRVMMPLYLRKDRPILEAKGVFKYEEDLSQFIFGDSTKVLDKKNVGNILRYDDRDALVKADGKINIGSGLKYVKVTAAGEMSTAFEEAGDSGTPPNKKVKSKMMAGVDIILPDKLLKIMTNDIKSSSFDARVIDYVKAKDAKFYANALAEFIPDKKDYDKTVVDMKLSGLKMPKKYNKHTFLFSRLPMVWDAELQSFISSETEIGVASINGDPINRMLKCYIEFKMPSNNDDRLYIYIKSPSDYYYFFGFKQGIMSVVSNNSKFNDEVINMKKKEKSIKMKDGEFYEIQPVNPGTAEMFINRVRTAKKN